MPFHLFPAARHLHKHLRTLRFPQVSRPLRDRHFILTVQPRIGTLPLRWEIHLIFDMLAFWHASIDQFVDVITRNFVEVLGKNCSQRRRSCLSP